METLINGTSLSALRWANKQALACITNHNEQALQKGCFRVYLQILNHAFPFLCSQSAISNQANTSKCLKNCTLALIKNDLEIITAVLDELTENEKRDIN